MSLQSISFVLSALALALASAAYFGPSDSADPANIENVPPDLPASAPLSVASSNSNIDELQQRVRVLEDRLAALSSAQLSNTDAERSMPADNGLADVFSMRDEAMRYKSDPAYAQARYAELESIVSDPNADPAGRIKALQELFSIAMTTQNFNSIDTELISPILELSETTDDPTVKVQAWDALRMVGMFPQVSEVLEAPMKRLAAQDSNPYLRRLAVEGLQTQLLNFGNGGPRADIEDFMRDRSVNDNDESVRRAAKQALDQVARIRQMIEQQGGQPEAVMFDVAPLGMSSGPVFVE